MASKYNKDFEIQIKQFVDGTNAKMKIVNRAAIYQLFSQIVDGTPLYVKGSKIRGQVKWNWRLSIGTYPTNTLTGKDVGGERTKKRASGQLGKIDGTQDVYISNSHIAASMLEYGHYPSPSKSGRTVGGFSIQAPQGIARIHAQQWNIIVAGVTKNVENKTSVQVIGKEDSAWREAAFRANYFLSRDV